MEKKILIGIAVFLAAVVSIELASSAAEFAVTSFACSPSEVVVNDVFSCTARIKNNGDASGSVSIATLYPDSNNWLESSNYPQSSGTSVSPGESTEVTFSGLRATKSGDNGFSKIMLDSVTDTFVADNNVKVNTINVVVSVGNSASSAIMGSTFTSSAEVTAGGSIDVTLTITINSGGCSIGSQSSQKTISDMQDGNKQSRTWTITQGTSGSCKYTISAAATGDGEVASKTDSTSSTITCTDCPTSSGSSSGGGSGGGGGGGGASTITSEELTKSIMQEAGIGESIKFKFGGTEHKISITNLTETTATVDVESEKQTLIFIVGEEKQIDFERDGKNEISLRLKSINIITKKASFVVTPLYVLGEEGVPSGGSGEEPGGEGEGKGIFGFSPKGVSKILRILLIVIIILIIALGTYLGLLHYKDRKPNFQRSFHRVK